MTHFDFDGSHNGHQPPNTPPPKEQRLHKVQKGRLNAFNRLRDLEMQAKHNDQYQNLMNNHSEGVMVMKSPVFPPDARIAKEPSETGASDQRFQSHHIDPIAPSKNPMTLVKDAISENNILHTPPPLVHHNDDIDQDEKQGIKCTFEKPCAWTYDKNVSGFNFEVKTGLQLKEMNLTGELT